MLRTQVLHVALAAAVSEVPLPELDRDLATFADESALRRLASSGLRGELLMATPCLFKRAPQLLGYYRLLLGFSQKEFYGSAFGTGIFRSMESGGGVRPLQEKNLGALCMALNGSAVTLLNALEEQDLSSRFLENLALLTLGPQLRGGSNVRKGSLGIETVFGLIRGMVANYVLVDSPRCLVVTNSAGREVTIASAPDPDIVITEKLGEQSLRNIVAIEVKSGTDFSNIHNRIGEAEKSHQKARGKGFVECWTILNVDNTDLVMARNESPSTDRFYLVNNLCDSGSAEYLDFASRIRSLVGLPSG